MLRRSLVSILVLISASLASAQRLPFGQYSIEDGLVDSVVFAISQDSNGYLWIGTRAGLSRFDGLDFVTFTIADGLAHNVIRDLFEDDDGTLWVATERGLSRFADGGFKSYTVEDGLPHYSVRAVTQDAGGAIWFGTYGGGVCRLIVDRIEVITVDDGLAHNKVRALELATNGDLWIGTSGGGVTRYRQGQMVTFGEAEGLGNLEVRSLFEDDLDRLWVGTRRGLYRQRGDRFEAVFEDDLGVQTFNEVTQDRRGRVWAGTREAGAVAIGAGTTTRYRTEEGLADNSVVSIFEDSEGNLWFGTYGGGMSRLSTEKIRSFQAAAGFSYANVYCLAEGDDGSMWFGTNGGGLSRLKDGAFTPLTTEDGLAHNKVISAMVDRSGGMWFGTLEGVTHLAGGRLETIRPEHGLAHNIVYDIVEDRHGTLWFATIEGLTRRDASGYTTFTAEDGLAATRVNFALEARDGTMWFGTAFGVSHLVDGQFHNLKTDDGLVSEFVNFIFEDDDGSLWICTNGGLSHLENGEFTNYTTEEGLSHHSCTVAMRSDNGALWVGTSRGVNRFDGRTFSVVTSKEGLVGDLVNRGGGLKDRDGNLWFGTTRGVSVIQADFSMPSAEPPPVHLTGAWLFDEPMSLDLPAVLKHDQNRLRFSFVGISFRRAMDVMYRYRLDGLDREWHTVKERTVQFSSLPPGSYTFEVAARTTGEWSAQPVTFSFEIVPPFWKRTWFVGLALFALGGSVLMRIWTLRRRTAILEERVRERTAEVQEINEELRWLALNDRLTNLRNRHYIYEIMPDEMSRIERRYRVRLERKENDVSAGLGLALIDLDHFKKVNDTHDHAAGDLVLAAAAGVFTEVTRDADVVARWGGEEFLVLYRDVDEARLHQMADRLREALKAHVVKIDGGNEISITCSVGYTHFPDHVSSKSYVWEDILKIADQALLEAKREGRDRAVGLGYDARVNSDELMSRVVGDIRQAMQDGLLVRFAAASEEE